MADCCPPKKWPRTSRPSACAAGRPAQPAQPPGIVQHRGKRSKNVPEHERGLQFRVPVAIKVAASSTSVAVYQQPDPRPIPHCRRLFHGMGSRADTGAAHEVSMGPYRSPHFEQAAGLLPGSGRPGPAGPDPALRGRRFWRLGRPGGGCLQGDLPGCQRRFFGPRSSCNWPAA